MAELATIARPYAEALDQSVAGADALALIPQLQALASVAGHPDMQQLADNPNLDARQVLDVLTGVVKTPLDAKVSNLLRTVVDNGRLAALPEIAAQFNALVKSRSGTSDATIESAFPIDAAQLPQVVAALEKRFARKLNATVVVEPGLIGGIRVVVGDEVLDTSVRGRLEKMRLALAA
ncbi:MAG: F0F1 ATP synthase subunit delta [Ideonella sp.]|nr:F0F1 ATP synthase subunit delta [Ideonella sp.]MCC7457334.1 F0F1 ATP synthase subunit delta [Nitrospira sp.]